jgi:hypothetical protein
MQRRRWTKLVTEWRPFDGKRRRSGPVRRWRDENVMTIGMNWMRNAQQRTEWNALGETFIQQWTENGWRRQSSKMSLSNSSMKFALITVLFMPRSAAIPSVTLNSLLKRRIIRVNCVLSLPSATSDNESDRRIWGLSRRANPSCDIVSAASGSIDLTEANITYLPSAFW